MIRILIAALLVALVGCRSADEPAPEPAESNATAETEAAVDAQDHASDDAPQDLIEQAGFETAVTPNAQKLAGILAAQPEAHKARHAARNPAETLLFFGIEPGMTVVEALPSGGWYSRVLLPYLGSEGRLIGANYPPKLFENFGFATEEFMADLATWVEDFPTDATEWCSGDCASVGAFFLGDRPAELDGTADAVLFIRALHNMARFQNEGVDDFLDQAFADALAVLKPGGVLGIVQHAAPDDADDGWTTGAAGYLTQAFVVARAEAAGFELEAASDINANPADRPVAGDVVWRLPPALGTSEEGSEERAALEAVGESNRMTLRFRKPGD
ncbi:class I SAM-dependent methyltransferase [Wenzhouxiangella sp. XN79A]|uniref:class I SAM-dependent methyltransferase n=1 Tax=Wenzhouxiangella sp. XN79A TaxID=2724193 RepID=UPI00144AC397|nr:class I SAM-dependent methyltransferase [Wenzhouxiangella sp. XN79A]NKI35624.1 class I SAM-dependent methyltransferase [Wenzhouxiangella sp. XN79A]